MDKNPMTCEFLLTVVFCVQSEQDPKVLAPSYSVRSLTPQITLTGDDKQVTQWLSDLIKNMFAEELDFQEKKQPVAFLNIVSHSLTKLCDLDLSK